LEGDGDGLGGANRANKVLGEGEPGELLGEGEPSGRSFWARANRWAMERVGRFRLGEPGDSFRPSGRLLSSSPPTSSARRGRPNKKPELIGGFAEKGRPEAAFLPQLCGGAGEGAWS